MPKGNRERRVVCGYSNTGTKTPHFDTVVPPPARAPIKPGIDNSHDFGQDSISQNSGRFDFPGTMTKTLVVPEKITRASTFANKEKGLGAILSTWRAGKVYVRDFSTVAKETYVDPRLQQYILEEQDKQEKEYKLKLKQEVFDRRLNSVTAENVEKVAMKKYGSVANMLLFFEKANPNKMTLSEVDNSIRRDVKLPDLMRENFLKMISEYKEKGSDSVPLRLIKRVIDENVSTADVEYSRDMIKIRDFLSDSLDRYREGKQATTGSTDAAEFAVPELTHDSEDFETDILLKKAIGQKTFDLTMSAEEFNDVIESAVNANNTKSSGGAKLARFLRMTNIKLDSVPFYDVRKERLSKLKEKVSSLNDELKEGEKVFLEKQSRRDLAVRTSANLTGGGMASTRVDSTDLGEPADSSSSSSTAMMKSASMPELSTGKTYRNLANNTSSLNIDSSSSIAITPIKVVDKKKKQQQQSLTSFNDGSAPSSSRYNGGGVGAPGRYEAGNGDMTVDAMDLSPLQIDPNSSPNIRHGKGFVQTTSNSYNLDSDSIFSTASVTLNASKLEGDTPRYFGKRLLKIDRSDCDDYGFNDAERDSIGPYTSVYKKNYPEIVYEPSKPAYRQMVSDADTAYNVLADKRNARYRRTKANQAITASRIELEEAKRHIMRLRHDEAANRSVKAYQTNAFLNDVKSFKKQPLVIVSRKPHLSKTDQMWTGSLRSILDQTKDVDFSTTYSSSYDAETLKSFSRGDIIGDLTKKIGLTH